jgi:hypothetical protein
MPALTTKDGEVQVSTARIARMAQRMGKLGGKGRGANYAEKARQRIAAGPVRKDDVAIVLAAGG